MVRASDGHAHAPVRAPVAGSVDDARVNTVLPRRLEEEHPLHRCTMVLVLALLATLGGAVPGRADGERLVPIDIETQSTALLVTAPRGDDRLFAVERAGRISVRLPDGSTRSFLDFSNRVGTAGEGGFLGLAFSPNHASDGHLWVHYTNTSGDTRIDRYTVSADPNRADPASRVEVLAVDQPRSNHNGGSIEFAPDGTLLVALGDGGGANDPFRNGQDLSTCLGGILRIGVLGRVGGGHGIPADNPFAGEAGRCQQLWAWGLRNPYRMSVDGGDVWIGDVGQDDREEINRLRFRARGNYNLGWPRYEGTLDRGGSVAGGDLMFPVEEYATNGSASVTGGYVVRTPSLPDLEGRYVYGDFVRGFVRVYDPATDRSATLFEDVGNIVSFGRDGRDGLYVLTFTGVQRISGAPVRGLRWFLGDDVPPRGSVRDLVFGNTRLRNRVPLSGDWNRDGVDTPGLAFTEGSGLYFALDDDLAGGQASRGNIRYGRAGDVPLSGDMDGDGDDDIVVRRGNRFHVDVATDGGEATWSSTLGRTTDTPLLGDVDGDGTDDIVVRRGNRWFADTDMDGRAELSTGFGRPTDTPLLGDVDGDGDDDMLVRRGNRWYVDDFRTGGGQAATAFSYGRSSDVPVTGSHDGDVADEPLVIR